MPSWDSGSSSTSSGPSWGTSTSGGLVGKRKERQNLLQKLGGAGKGVGKTALNPVLKALEIADLGRSAVVSGAKEIDDAVPLLEQLDKLVLGKKPKDSQDSSASLSDLVRQTKQHIGYGDFVDTGNAWADRALGFAGDVALDPLSYVTFGATQAGTAGSSAVRVSAKDAARELAAKGEKELAETVLRRNVGALTAEQAADAGLKQGATIGIGSARVRIPGTAGATRGLNKVTAPIRETALTSKLGRAAATKLSAAAEAVPNGSLLDRLHFDDALQASKAKAAGLGQRHRQTLGELIRTHKGADTDELRRALEGEAPSSVASSDVRKLLNDVADDTERLTGRVVPRLEDYLPHQLTRDFKESLAEGGIRGRRSGGTADSLLRREKRVGQQWFGRELETGSIDEMNAIAKDALGDNYVGVFKENPWEIVHSYIGSMEREAQRSGLDRTLVERGIGGAKVTPSSEKAIPGAKAAQKRLLREADNEAALAAKGPGIELGPDGAFVAGRAPEASTVDLIRGSMPSAADVRSTAAKGTRRAAKAERLVEDQDALRDALYALKERGPAAAPAAPAPVAVAPKITPEDIARGNAIFKEIADIDALGAKVDKFRSTAAATGDRPSQKAAEARLAELGAQRGALASELKALKEKVTSTAREVDHASAAVDGAEDVAAANAQRLAAMQSMKADLKTKAAAELAARKEADHFFAEAAKMRATRQGDLAAIATLEGMMKRSEAEAAQHSLRAMEKLNAASAVRLTHVTSDARAMYEDGLKMFAKDKWAEPWVAEAVASVDNLLSPGEIGRFAKLFDTVTSRWKAYSLLSPGFHERNFMGGMFNNSLAGMDPRHYFTYAKGARAIRKGGLDAIVDPEIRAAFKAMDELGILEGHNVRDLSDVAGTGSKKGLLGSKLTAVDPSNLDNAALRTNARAARAVERELRGPLFIDTYLKTGSAERAMEQVVKYHFDYSDLSSFEQKYMKRLFPFYTWTRKNFPLQINEMIAKPGRYTRYLHAKRNIEMGTEPDTDVPSYYNDLLAIRSPFHSGDNPLYLTPDLPFRDVTEVADPMRAISQLNPLIKTPLEASSGTQYFTGVPFTNRLTPVPRTWTPIAQLIRPFNGKLGLPKIATGKDGALYISDKDAYKIEQMLPLLGRMRRLAPSEERYQTRATTTWLSFVFGLGGRTLDEASQFGEVNRQVRELQSIRRRQQELGS